MTLRELLNVVLESTPDDWHKITCWGASSGPSYRDHPKFFEVYEGQKDVLVTRSHPEVAVYIPDVSITMAWGLDSNPDFKEDWANKFPDPTASSHFVDLFYNDALVFRDLYVNVDGARCGLPLPSLKRDKDGKVVAREVPHDKYTFFNLLESIGGSVIEFDQYFRRAGFTLVEENWPEWLPAKAP